MLVFLQDHEGFTAGVKIVDWSLDNGREGRIVDVEDNNLVAVVCTGLKQHTKNFLDWPGVMPLLPQTGVTWSRARRVGQLKVINALPGKWVRLRDMWNMALRCKYEKQQREREQALMLQDGSANAGQEGEDGDASMLELPGFDSCALCDQAHPIIDEVQGNGKAQGIPDMVRSCPLCLVPLHNSCLRAVLNHFHLQWAKSSIVGGKGTSSSSSSTAPGCGGKLPNDTRLLPAFFRDEQTLSLA